MSIVLRNAAEVQQVRTRGLDPVSAERHASEIASKAPDGMEGWRKAGALLSSYRALWAAHQDTLAELARADAMLAAVDDEFWPEELPDYEAISPAVEDAIERSLFDAPTLAQLCESHVA
jgi:hypothetical protein